MTDFIREVDEDVRQDQMKRLFARYWPLAIALAVLVLVGVGAWQAYIYVTTEKAQTAGGRYLDALDLARNGKRDQAIAGLKGVEADGTAGYKLLARLRLAAETGATDKVAGAKAFDDIAADPAVDPAIVNIARLRAAILLMDAASYPDLKSRLEPLADANSPVRNAARELLALAALKADAVADAGRDLDAIEADPTASAQQRQRAGVLQGLVRGAGRAPAGTAPVPAAAPAAAEVPPAAVPAPPTAANAPAGHADTSAAPAPPQPTPAAAP